MKNRLNMRHQSKRRKDAALQCFEEGAGGKTGGFPLWQI